MIKNDQHFMVDTELLTKISSLVKKRLIFEIGPGKGALTNLLLDKASNLVIVEKDLALIPVLNKRFLKEIEEGKLQVINENVLDLSLKKYADFEMISNLPYSISEPFFYKIIKEGIKKIILVTGKDFYENLLKEKKLGLYCSIFFNLKKHFEIRPSSFRPEPRVDSVCFTLERKESTIFSDIFSQTDKKLYNALLVSFSLNRTKNEARFLIDSLKIPEALLKKRISHLSNFQFLQIFSILKKKQFN